MERAVFVTAYEITRRGNTFLTGKPSLYRRLSSIFWSSPERFPGSRAAMLFDTRPTGPRLQEAENQRFNSTFQIKRFRPEIEDAVVAAQDFGTEQPRDRR